MSLLDYILDDDNNIRPEIDKMFEDDEQEKTKEQDELEDDEDPSLSIRELTPKETKELFNSFRR